jgi:surfeit locus 1 family protein
MRRLPVIATLVVALAVAAMIALGLWQIRRAHWKESLLADYAAAAAMPALDLDPLLDHPPAASPPLAFRRALVTCRAGGAQPQLRGGRSRETGQGGYSYLVPCRPGAVGLAARILVNAGWTPLPDNRRRLTLNGLVAGTFGADEDGRPLVLTSAASQPPLRPSAAPSIEDIPNNHMSYAVQWFAFAAIALVIYALALRRRRGRELPPEP